MTKLLTSKYSDFMAVQALESITEQTNTAFYVYAGVHGDVIGDIPTPADDNRETVINAYRNMIFGKRILPGDASLVIRYIPWATSKVFAMYDDNDKDLFSKDFYCTVDEGSFLHTYKCLNNNFGLPSTVEPAYSYVTDNSNYVFTASDGYVWKYMFSISEIDKNKFQTPDFFPVVLNSNVAASAVRGSFDVIHIEQNDLSIPGGGKKYDNYFTGTFSTEQLRIGGNNKLYAVSNALISYTTGFYKGCLLYLSGGTGSGQYATVNGSFHNATGNYLSLVSEFPIGPQNGTTFEVYPSVNITGAGTETIKAVGRALVNSTGSNSVYKIELFQNGRDYVYATANVAADTTVTQDVNFVAAELRPIYGPQWGHGTDPAAELGANSVEFSVQFANSENGLVPVQNRYQQVGIIRDPLFSNVQVSTANQAGLFVVGETLYKIDPVRINANVNISNTSSIITGETSVLSTASIVLSGASGSYVPGDVMNITGGVPIQNAQVKVLSTLVNQVAINNHGTGYTACTVFTANINLGTATTNCIISVTTNSSGFCNSLVITNAGVYTANPPYLPNTTPVGSVGGGSGLTVSLGMGLQAISIYDKGAYALIPTDLSTNQPLANTGDGSGAQLLLTFSPTLSADFQNQFQVGDFVYITSSDHTQQQLSTVKTITNATSMTIDSDGLFSCSAAHMYLPQTKTSAEVVDAANVSVVVLDYVDQELNTNDFLVGAQSGAKAQVASVSRNGTNKNFNTFVQLYKYDISILSGTFINNEIIFQGTSLANATATALLHSVLPVGLAATLYCSNQVGVFDKSVYLQGATSLAAASITTSYSPEVEFGSGDVLYIENFEPVTRANNRTENWQIILSY